jgi:predicted metal-binding membrane protein
MATLQSAVSAADPPGSQEPPGGGLERANRREQFVLITCSAVVMLAAWSWLGFASRPASLHSALVPSPPHAHGHSFFSVVIMWQAMMVAMMSPAVLPWLLAFSRLQPHCGRHSRKSLGAIAAFASGYFVMWLIYSVGASFVQVALQRSGWLPLDGRIGGAGGSVVLILAGVFQMVPFRRACLRHCRNPLMFLLSRWRNGPAGGFRLGLSHGAYCVGCCWLLMLTGFAMGVMNIAWMAVLTVVVCVEQLAPRGERIGVVAGIGLAGWGLALLVR